MLRSLVSRRLARSLPIFRLLAVAQIALLARRHLGALSGDERRRLLGLVRHSRSLTPAEREELRTLTAKLDAKAFTLAAAQKFSPVPLPGRLFGGR